jgi:hypothetical protein
VWNQPQMSAPSPHVPQGTIRACLDPIPLQRLRELVCPTKREMRGRAHAKGARRGRGSPHALLSDRAAPPTSLTTGPLACVPHKMRQPRWDSLSSRGTCSAYSHTTSLLSATPARSSPRCPSAPRTASLLRISAAYLALPSLVGLYQQRVA